MSVHIYLKKTVNVLIPGSGEGLMFRLKMKDVRKDLEY